MKPSPASSFFCEIRSSTQTSSQWKSEGVLNTVLPPVTVPTELPHLVNAISPMAKDVFADYNNAAD
ncbi:hypothetical protein [Pelagicoccus albus]|uniref:Uncharacterized protein n=1 Tax=Pelagicoccus albus TaxID=415222 RepID=A0A7X1E873_9BACT|nr:hypothetical protein [Pelagicoccus albus]MBC2605853.1 hypothetical protein [Pelagicoccus albus]